MALRVLHPALGERGEGQEGTEESLLPKGPGEAQARPWGPEAWPSAGREGARGQRSEVLPAGWGAGAGAGSWQAEPRRKPRVCTGGARGAGP